MPVYAFDTAVAVANTGYERHLYAACAETVPQILHIPLAGFPAGRGNHPEFILNLNKYHTAASGPLVLSDNRYNMVQISIHIPEVILIIAAESGAGVGISGKLGKVRRESTEIPFGAYVRTRTHDYIHTLTLALGEERVQIPVAREVEAAFFALMEVPGHVGFDGVHTAEAGF
jgi:hypothetical protein